jgi:hypothetical protein
MPQGHDFIPIRCDKNVDSLCQQWTQIVIDEDL